MFLFCIFGIGVAQAAPRGLPTASVELDGYLWSENIGWVSLNCKTGGADGPDVGTDPDDVCLTSDYNVTMDDATGQLSGWAWSGNVGWISFGKLGSGTGAALSSFPSIVDSPGTIPVSARAVGVLSSGLTLEGWVRVCAGTQGGVCAVMTDSAVSGGWNGWISLKGDTIPAGGYQVTINNLGKINPASYGWGDTVVGWLSFDLTALLIPNATLTGTACTIARDASSCSSGVVNWSFTDTAVVTRRVSRTSPAVTINIGGTPPALIGTSNVVTFNAGVNLFRAYYTYPVSPIGNTLSLTAGCGVNDTYYPAPADKCDQKMPTVTITADKTLVRAGDTVNISWTITPPAAQPLDASIVCKVYGPGMPAAAQTVSGTANSLAIKNGTSFKVACTPPGGAGADITASITVDVVPTTQEI